MAKYAVVRTGGKQYLVEKGDEIIVEKIHQGKSKTTALETLAVFGEDGSGLDLGTPNIKAQVEAEIIEELLGDKTLVARFKAKVRYRRTRGFRPVYTKLKITKV